MKIAFIIFFIIIFITIDSPIMSIDSIARIFKSFTDFVIQKLDYQIVIGTKHGPKAYVDS